MTVYILTLTRVFKELSSVEWKNYLPITSCFSLPLSKHKPIFTQTQDRRGFYKDNLGLMEIQARNQHLVHHCGCHSNMLTHDNIYI